MDKQVINLPDVIGGGYGQFWNFKGRFCVCKGSRGSKKSKTTALWHIVKMMQYPDSNTLVVRKTERTLKDSCFADLRWAINRLGVDEYWRATTNPLELTYLPTGQKIIFRGFDDPMKITSITVPKGSLCWCWIEEAYEINKEEDFDMLNESIRGAPPEGLFKRFTITFNPWTDKHWLKRRFFDTPDTPDKIALTTTYRCNEWLDENDRKVFEDMKIRNPRRWRVAANGEWGIIDGIIYENFIEEEFDLDEIRQKPNTTAIFGLDFGYTNDPTSLFCGIVDPKNKRLYVFDEMYERGMSNERIYEKISRMGYAKEKIIADCAEPKSIDRLYELGLRRIRKARKGKDSINNGISYCQEFAIIVHPRCVNFLTEISTYTWDEDKFGHKINKPIDDFNHLMDAMRYAMMAYSRGSMVSFFD
jgi:phage terminase large subunit